MPFQADTQFSLVGWTLLETLSQRQTTLCFSWEGSKEPVGHPPVRWGEGGEEYRLLETLLVQGGGLRQHCPSKK